MAIFFHILSTGGGAGASRITRYIAERDKDLAREGPGSRALFSEKEDSLSYRHADWLLEPRDGHPAKGDLIHFSIMIEEEDFEKLGANERKRQVRFREVIREGMKGVASELNLEELTWVAGIHRNSENPHAHIVFHKNVIEREIRRSGRINRIPKALLPHRESQNGSELYVNGLIADKFEQSLINQQEISRHRSPDRVSASEPKKSLSASHWRSDDTTIEHQKVAFSWNAQPDARASEETQHGLLLGRELVLKMRLSFAEAWYDRALNHGDIYRFSVFDQSTSDERKLSELDVHRRSNARAARLAKGDSDLRKELVASDLVRHGHTFQELQEARETKIATLEKDIGSLRAKVGSIAKLLSRSPATDESIPMVDRQILSELQEQAIKLNLAERVQELEKLRTQLAIEHQAPTRTDAEAAQLSAQLNVARADLLAKDTRWEKFEASVHLHEYEITGERWSLAALDKQIARRSDDAKLIPARAARVELISLVRLNYSPAGREEAAADVIRLTDIREGLVEQIEERRLSLSSERQSATLMVGILESAYRSEREARFRSGLTMPQPKYESHHVIALESSAEVLRDPQLLREVHIWEKATGARDEGTDWQGRAAAREITSAMALAETKQRLDHFLESRQVTSLHFGNHHTSTLKQVEARTVTEYLARLISESQSDRTHRLAVKSAAREQHARLVNDHEKARLYHEAAHELASTIGDRTPNFTDKEKINLEIYAERQNDDSARERYLQLARAEFHQERDIAITRGR